MDLTLGLCSFALIYLLVLLLWSNKLRSPPSPWGLPLIGHIHLLVGMPLHRALQSISQRYGPIVYLKMGMRPSILISSKELAKELLTAQDVNFCSKPYISVGEHINYNFASLGTTKYGEYYKNVRKLCLTEFLSVKSLDSSSSIRKKELTYLLNAILKLNKHQVDLRELLSIFTFNTITNILLSKRYLNYEHGVLDTKEALEFKKLMTQIMDFALMPVLSNFVPWYLRWLDWKVSQFKLAHAQIDSFLQKIVHERRQTTQKYGDFLDIMLQYFGEQETYTKANLLDLILAGTETSVITSEWLIASVMSEPQVLKKVQEEIGNAVGNARMVQESDFPKLEYLDMIIKETFRRRSPVPVIIRECNNSTKLGDYDVPKGTNIIVNTWALGMDSGSWENPTKFLPERFLESTIDLKGRNFELLPFGSGRRSCPGMPLGLINVKLLVANLMHGFDWSLMPGMTLSTEDCYHTACRMKYPLRPLATPRLPKEAYANI